MCSQPLYAAPIQVSSPSDCFFYHFMDLPGIGTVGKTWDLRDCVQDYLGDQDFAGARVLDVGAASGYLSFEMEKRGARVVSFDMDSVDSWNFVPHYSLTPRWERLIQSRERCHRQMKNAYWYAHQRFRSNAQVHYGNVYDLPLELGNFDVVFLGMILPHLRDPFQALYSASRLAADRIIVTNPGKKRMRWNWLDPRRYQAKFMPSAKNSQCDVWWALSTSCIERMLGTLGFRVIEEIPCTAICWANGKRRRSNNLSLVAKRVAGAAEGDCQAAAGDSAAARELSSLSRSVPCRDASACFNRSFFKLPAHSYSRTRRAMAWPNASRTDSIVIRSNTC